MNTYSKQKRGFIVIKNKIKDGPRPKQRQSLHGFTDGQILFAVDCL